MPLTEHLWTWDKFLRGGPDLEFGLLGITSILCFGARTLSTLQAGDQSAAHHATTIGFALYLDDGSFWATPEIISRFQRGRTEAPALDTYNLPLLI